MDQISNQARFVVKKKEFETTKDAKYTKMIVREGFATKATKRRKNGLSSHNYLFI